ncbi:MAG: hypothetical protein JW958_04220 [Candidatus Eisenbacteria bacterium]|nr:hypothetical protein [Candidatus Eisenbacteria bacterium]
MKNTNRIVGGLVLVLALVISGSAIGRGSATDVTIRIAPSVLQLDTVQGGEITVHADIPLSRVDTFSVELSGVPALYTKADARGNLVAKFDENEIEALVSPPEATLTLIGLTVDGEPFTGSGVVGVRD